MTEDEATKELLQEKIIAMRVERMFNSDSRLEIRITQEEIDTRRNRKTH